MNCEYIKNGRYQQPTIWVNDFKPLGEYPYPSKVGSMVALSIGQSLELYKALLSGLREAGQIIMLGNIPIIRGDDN